MELNQRDQIHFDLTLRLKMLTWQLLQQAGFYRVGKPWSRYVLLFFFNINSIIFRHLYDMLASLLVCQSSLQTVMELN